MVKASSRTPSLEHETAAGFPDRIIIGVDEVGRGCLAGPVMAGAFAFPCSTETPEWVSKIRDSKLLSAKARDDLHARLQDWTPHWSVAEASVAEIDSINILNAAELAMKRAFDAVVERIKKDLGEHIESRIHVLVDGNRVPRHFRGKATAIVGGDRLCLSIACASILAKVIRDRRLEQLDDLHPGYGLAVHKGYGTPEHLAALQRLKPCPEHRRSFSPVRQALQAATVD
jgi:ribonuclease HII